MAYLSKHKCYSLTRQDFTIDQVSIVSYANFADYADYATYAKYANYANRAPSETPPRLLPDPFGGVSEGLRRGAGANIGAELTNFGGLGCVLRFGSDFDEMVM